MTMQQGYERRPPRNAPPAGGNDSGALTVKKRKACPFTASKVSCIDFKDLETLKQFITERGKILPRRITGVSHFYQNKLKQAIKRARHMALIPFVAEE